MEDLDCYLQNNQYIGNIYNNFRRLRQDNSLKVWPTIFSGRLFKEDSSTLTILINIFLPLLFDNPFYFSMKRSLAPPRRDRPTGGALNSTSRKTPMKGIQDRGTSSEKSTCLPLEFDTHDKEITQNYEQKYRNKNINAVPTQMLMTFSTLTTLDVSYNKLTDSQVELIMNSCSKLTTFCMQGNLTTLIPAAIHKLKYLVNFRHDWIKMDRNLTYEPEYILSRIKEVAKKPSLLGKSEKVYGIIFNIYCIEVLKISFDRKLIQKIQKVDLSQFARNNILKVYEEYLEKTHTKPKAQLAIINEGEERSIIPGCFGNFGFDNDSSNSKKKEQRWKDTLSQADTDAISVNIRIEDIRDITDKETVSKLEKKAEQIQYYRNPLYPLHELFANFDHLPTAAAEIDGMLLKGYNPNQVDQNGLSPFHLCIVYKQKKGLEYLLEISSNNPGFFDLEMGSVKQSRNILHLSVFMKNYYFTKLLIEFGLPTYKRDLQGARIQHLVDQNYQFLILLRKLLRKKTETARSLSILSVPHFPQQHKKKYVKHPTRQKEQNGIRMMFYKNEKLLEMYENGCGIPKQ